MAAAYLTRGTGPVYEWQAPYKNLRSAADVSFSPALKIDEIIFIPERKSALDNQAIKQTVIIMGQYPHLMFLLKNIIPAMIFLLSPC